ncbi:MAG: hypothetical protein ACYTEL_16465 [Planctomycetota bacterium]|jgi:hypothetical protein
MAKSKEERAKKTTPRREARKASGRPREASTYVNSLLELHKLQGVLLVKLKKEV